ncbi:retrovirus-related pol polyprotein from transposon TNT 1-94 [Tanacetum coccineum]
MAKNINTRLDAEDEINTSIVEINTGIEDVNTGSTKVDTGRTSISTSKEARLEEAIRLQAQMDEEVAKHIHLDKMVAKRVQEEQELSKQQLKRKAKVQEFYTEEDWDTIRAKLEANTEVVKSLQGESISNDDFAKRMVEMINEKKKFYAEQKAKAKRKLKTEFEKLMKSIESFVPMETEARVKRHGLQLEQETSKKQKIDIEDASITKGKDEVVKEEEAEVPFNNEREAFAKDKVEDASSESEIRVDSIPNATKPPTIVNWKIISQTSQKAAYQIIRRDGSNKIYMSFRAILKDFSRDDLIELYKLVIKKYEANRPEEMYDRVLWGDLKTMFDPPLSDDAICSLPLQQKIINWSCDKEKTKTKRQRNLACLKLHNKIELLRERTDSLRQLGNYAEDLLLPTVFWAEAVNTACYVLNRVLVTKPHNKTPYELIIGRAPSISFMRPFGCPVTILNTLDPLGKFDGKAEEGFLVGYSVNSKAFRVFNTKTRKVEENLHVNFLENKPNVAGQGPNWLFDIDSLTNSMNYQPVSAGNQTNKNAGPQETNGNTGLKKTVDAGQTEEENVSSQQYIIFLLWSSISSSYKSSDDKAKDYTVDDDACRKTVQEPASETFSPVGPSSGASFVPFGGSFPIDVANLPHDPLIPELEDTAEIHNTGIFDNAYDDHDLETLNTPYVHQSVDAKADFNNMEPSTVVSPIPTTRVHSIHPKDQIIGDSRSTV